MPSASRHLSQISLPGSFRNFSQIFSMASIRLPSVSQSLQHLLSRSLLPYCCFIQPRALSWRPASASRFIRLSRHFSRPSGVRFLPRASVKYAIPWSNCFLLRKHWNTRLKHSSSSAPNWSPASRLFPQHSMGSSYLPRTRRIYPFKSHMPLSPSISMPCSISLRALSYSFMCR